NLSPSMFMPAAGNRSSLSFANFKITPPTPPEKLNCNNDGAGNGKFQQVDLMGTLSLYKDAAVNAGLAPFSQNPGDPAYNPIIVSVQTSLDDSGDNECNAFGTLMGLSFRICSVRSSTVCGDSDINPTV